MVHLQKNKLFNRQIRTTLPSANVEVKTCNTQKRKPSVTNMSDSYQKYLMVPLFVSVQIKISSGQKWEKLSANIQTQDPTTYLILQEMLCDNLIPTKEPFHVTKEYSQSLCSEGTSNQVQDQATPQSEPPPQPSPAPPPGPLPVTQPSTIETKMTRSGRTVRQPRRYADYHMDKK